MAVYQSEDISVITDRQFKNGFEPSNVAGARSKKISVCTKCERPMLGHPKPRGQRCKFAIENDSDILDQLFVNIENDPRFDEASAMDQETNMSQMLQTMMLMQQQERDDRKKEQNSQKKGWHPVMQPISYKFM